ncbi:Alanine aminotransferase 2 mitochondrial [Zea mays]|uniref:Alanine aminotransferase 2 mitochondrial n=1 Tax=Zea mays TaxID=4577 RepID=A0A1D6I4V0_MAIZE|nr:Alanine aminotransferase 2 mitochondrial [Zea mays]
MSYNKAPSITAETINPRVKIIRYAPCGEIVKHAARLEQEIEENPASIPFQEIIYCNLGNPQVLGQPPLTFFREVTTLNYPQKHKRTRQRNPCSIRRARRILNSIPSKDTGGYTDCRGIKCLRQVVADGITARDGFPSTADDIFLTDGATSAINLMMQILIRSHEDGILSPLPEYPLYSASIILHGGTMVQH